MTTPFSDYPDSFPSNSRPASRVYRKRLDCAACRSDTLAGEGMETLTVLPEEGLSVVAIAHDALPPGTDSEWTPVFAFPDDVVGAIPTGRVFVQATAGVEVAAAVEAAGYVIESTVPYAPNAAWIVAADDTVASALTNLTTLIASADFESVEPQMLRPSMPRESDRGKIR